MNASELSRSLSEALEGNSDATRRICFYIQGLEKEIAELKAENARLERIEAAAQDVVAKKRIYSDAGLTPINPATLTGNQYEARLELFESLSRLKSALEEREP